jgi:hypothetical protein
MNAKELINGLHIIADTHNLSLEDIDIKFRHNHNSSPQEVNYIEEDLYDAKTNSILESVMLLSYIDDLPF